MNTQRPLTVTIAVALQGLLSLLGIIFSIHDLTAGPNPEGPPMFIIILSLIIGVLGLATAWGIWQGKRWGVTSTLVLRGLDILGTAPGIFFAPTLVLQILCVVGIALSVVVIVLLLLPASRRVLASS
jgi:uncharacterized membrane protein